MISAYNDMVRDALYPKKRVLTKRNKSLKIAEPRGFSPDEIRALRRRLKLSVGMFASLFAVSDKTVEAWEAGTNVPSGPALRLMSMIIVYPDILVDTRTFYETAD